MNRRLWVRFLRRMRWYRYLRATAIRAYAAIGPKRTIVGLFAAVAGGMLHVELGFAVTVLVALLFLVQWLVLTPSELWDEAKHEEAHKDAKTVVHVHAGATYVDKIISPEGVSGTAGVASRSEPRSPRRSKRGPTDPPPSLGL